MLKFETDQEKLKKLKEFLEKYKNLRPKPKREYDQFFATEETLIRRASILENFIDQNKEILFLGDGDLNSLALSIFYSNVKIFVVDIDKDILNFINFVAEKEKFNIETYHHDLRNPLPKDKFKKFNLIFTDPPYTPSALELWLTRCIEASLGSGTNKKRKKPEVLSSKYYFVCYGYTNKETERGLKIQEIITKMGLVIQEKIRDFNNYYGAESLGSKSDLYLLQPTPKINLREIDIERTKFYTHQKF
jgi:N4-bis(aminopropyl)spermidine synthase